MIKIYPEETVGKVRRIHGVNGTPIIRNWYVDLRYWFKRWEIPVVRTHDCPYDAFDTVDLHHIFPNPEADPDDPKSYRFKLSDDLLSATRDSGVEIYFRLGETIEHQPTMMWNRPERWTPELIAKVCLNIVRHYNEGWANGFEWGIQYWEFWNEPNGPKNWTGTAEQFYELYRAVAVAIKQHDPKLKIGLAGFTSGVIEVETERYKAWRDGFKQCAEDGIPIDFVSWHQYLSDWNNLSDAADRIRSFLNSVGLHNAESHLGEWGYRPIEEMEEDRLTIFQTRNIKRYDMMERVVRRQESHEGAALILGVLSVLQNIDVDLAQYYTATNSESWGLFTNSGNPNTRAVAFEVFSEFLKLNPEPQRVRSEVEGLSIAVLPALENGGRKLRIALASLREIINLPVVLNSGEWKSVRLRVLDTIYDWKDVSPPEVKEGVVNVPIAGKGIAVLELERVDGEGLSGSDSKSVDIRKGAEGDW